MTRGISAPGELGPHKAGGVFWEVSQTTALKGKGSLPLEEGKGKEAHSKTGGKGEREGSSHTKKKERGG